MKDEIIRRSLLRRGSDDEGAERRFDRKSTLNRAGLSRLIERSINITLKFLSFLSYEDRHERKSLSNKYMTRAYR